MGKKNISKTQSAHYIGKRKNRLEALSFPPSFSSCRIPSSIKNRLLHPVFCPLENTLKKLMHKD